MRRIVLIVAVMTFVAAWAGRRGGPVGRRATLIGFLVSERLARLAMPRMPLGDELPQANG
jgi:hypothetical protein